MFRTRPPAFALACVALWAVQLAVGALLLLWGERLGAALAWRWQAAGLLASAALGALLLAQLPRALQWRPRRHPRASPEVLQERQRIARDLHDHVGAQIVGAMALLDARDPAAQPLAQALERCLLDLRLLVDSMDGDDDTLPARLARLRHRLQPALDRRGIALQWDVALCAQPHWPTGAAARECTAIVQEAVSNVLQHAGATTLAVRLQPLQGGGWRLQVQDNGRGLDAGAIAAGQAGHGLAGMRRRAERLGARLQWLAVPGGGLCVQVTKEPPAPEPAPAPASAGGAVCKPVPAAAAVPGAAPAPAAPGQAAGSTPPEER